MKAPQEIIALVERFDQNFEAYQSGKYNETQIRREFIDPFFKALGWDVDNTSGYAEAYKDVIHEDALKIGATSNAPDYSFRIGGTRKFFVEAKKPSVNIGTDIGPAYQLRRYAWSAKLPLSILTDFQEFAVYDCRVKPDKADKASTARIIFLNYKDYLTRWEEIAAIFSKEEIMKGSFDKYAEKAKTKRGTASVDAAFLAEIDSWRQALAQNIALRNSKLSQRELNYSVGKTIDRIIFLRICEDRGIEPYGQLLALQNGVNIYQRLIEIYYDADDKYNSGLFHFKQEKERSAPPDDLTLTLSVDDKIFKDIFKSLYYPESPYEFSVLPADILGQVYEQFLGKVIHLTPGHRAKVEEKPEVRKAGGVYYTPTYIVDYIVKNTVGKLLEGKTPKTAEKLRILDPACGSGSFLIGAYQYLLDWHRDKYVDDNPEKYAKGKNPALYQKIRNEWRLTTAERKRILLNNIYGVDIDPQAVEVTKLSLLLKVLEGESDQTIKSSFKLFNERALPDLGSNIKCGNSLIGPDFYEGKQTSFLDTEEMQRVNAFDWEKEFPEIFKAGGFDAVIGNPPYGADISRSLLDYIRLKYTTAQGELDSYALFIEKSISLLHPRGLYGVILPDTWLTLINANILRKWLLENYSIIDVVALNESVFTGATIDPLVIVIDKQKPLERHTVSVSLASKKMKLFDLNVLTSKHEYIQSNWLNNNSCQIKIYITEDASSIIDKMRVNSSSLSEYLDYRAGCKPYEAGKGFPPQTKNTLSEKPFTSHSRKANDWQRLIRGNDVQRYLVTIKKPEWIKYGEWLAAPRDPQIFKGERLLIQAIRNPSLKNRIVATFTTDEMIARINVYTLIKNDKHLFHYFYILGILNSRLANWFLMKDYGLHTYVITGVMQLPIRIVDFNKPAEKKTHDKMVELVEQILELNKQLPNAKTDHEKTLIQRQIDATDKQIDKLVFELYDLTAEEIAIVEGKESN